MSYFTSRILILTLVALLCACSATMFHVGSDFDMKIFTEQVERGTTSQNQVRTWLGVPTSTGVRIETDGQRFTEWTYYFASGSMASVSDTRLKTLQIKYDEHGVVQGYNWSSNH